MAYGQESFNGANVQAAAPLPGGSACFKSEENFASLHLEMGNLIEQLQQSLNRMSHLWVLMSKEVEGPASSAAAAAGSMSGSLADSLRASGLGQGMGSGLGGASGAFAGTRPGGSYGQTGPGDSSMRPTVVSGLNAFSEDSSQRMPPQSQPPAGPPGFASQSPQMMGQPLQPPRKTGSKALAAAAAMAREVEDSGKSMSSGGNSGMGSANNSNNSGSMGPMSVPFSQNEGPVYQGMGGHFLPRTQFQSAPMRVPVGLSPPEIQEADEEEDEDVPLPTHFLNRAHYASAPIRSVYGNGKLGGLSSAIGMAGSPGISTVPEACDMAMSQHYGRDQQIGTGALRSYSADAIGPGDFNENAEDSSGSGWPTVGSAQHNAGLCKPCLFWYQGLCHKGQRCLFCHIPHDPDEVSRVRPSKKTRNLLQPQKRR